MVIRHRVRQHIRNKSTKVREHLRGSGTRVKAFTGRFAGLTKQRATQAGSSAKTKLAERLREIRERRAEEKALRKEIAAEERAAIRQEQREARLARIRVEARERARKGHLLARRPRKETAKAKQTLSQLKQRAERIIGGD